MKYKIVFELPDNETVLSKINTAQVEWAVWGYKGCAHAEPEQTIKPKQKTWKWVVKIEEKHTEMYDARIPHWFCGCCRTEYDSYVVSRINYCFNCGVKLEV